jgi:uncharacterized protein YcfJ
MRWGSAAVIVLCTLLMQPMEAKAIGCLSGGAAGALAGHMAGHGILGALGGCIAGHTWHKHTVNKQQLQNTQTYNAQRQAADPNYKSPWQ